MEYDLQLLRERLERRGFDAVVAGDRQEAAELIASRCCVQPGMVVGMGNSLTLQALGLKDLWEAHGCRVYQHAIDSTEEETKAALLAPLYLTSANALAYDGHIVNIDGTGNRVSATCYGPEQVVFVIGQNKIAPTLEDAISRARNVAAVKNATRYGRKTPCVVTGKCEDCLAPECVCGVMAIHRRRPYGVKALVVLVAEDLGL